MSRTPTTRLAISKPNPGTGEPYDPSIDLGSNWDKVDANVGAFLCTSSTRPGTPYGGQIIRETDTGRMYVWSATALVWLPILVKTGAGFFFDDLMIGERATTADIVYGGRVASDANRRYEVRADGRINWGPGTTAPDTNLYRDAADSLRTDDAFACFGAPGGRLKMQSAQSVLASSYTVTSTNADTGLTVSLTPATATNMTHITAHFRVDKTATGSAAFLIINLVIDGTIVSRAVNTEPVASAVTVTRNMNLNWIVTNLSVAAHTIKVQASVSSSGLYSIVGGGPGDSVLSAMMFG